MWSQSPCNLRVYSNITVFLLITFTALASSVSAVSAADSVNSANHVEKVKGPEDLLDRVSINGKQAFQVCEKKRGLHQKAILKLKVQALMSESKKVLMSGKEHLSNNRYAKEVESNSSGYVGGTGIKFRELAYLEEVYLCAYKFK